MEGLSFVEPGFPVYKALTVPLIEDGELKCVVEVSKDFVETGWKEVLSGLKEHINKFTYFTQRIKKPREKTNTYEYYETLADIIALYFRQPLQLDPIPSVMVSPLKIYSAARKIKSIIEVYSDDPLKTLNSLSDIVTDKIRPEDLRRLIDCWFNLPADTRPGYNTSGLIPHLLTTSAIAWALAVEQNLAREDAAKLRLAALLHDMSKPFNYRRHWEITDKVVELVFDREVLGSDFVDELASLVKRHHIQSGDMLGRIIHRADVIASSIDRVRKLTEKILKKELGERFEVLYGKGEEAWGEWARLEEENPGIIKELSLKYVESLKYVKKVAEDSQQERDESGKHDELLYFLVDVGGVQNFIYRTVKLRTVAASSYMVDFLISAYILMGLQYYLEKNRNIWMPVEAFMINGGGNLSFIAPASLRNDVEDALEKIKENIGKKLGLRIYFASTYITDNFSETAARAAAAVSLQKITIDKTPEAKFVSPNLCNYCYTNNVESRDKNVCNICEELYEIGDKFHFRNKWGAELYLLPGDIKIGGIRTPYESVKDPMYVIAGHKPDEKLDSTQQDRKRKRNVAVVKFDANMMGVFFARSVSLADALERSWRVDMSMKEAYQKTLCELYKAVKDFAGEEEAELAVRQCYLGTLYMGGDDGLVICPSWASIPLAVGISKYFNENMGGVLTLSVGIAATSPEHDVWSSIDAASALLNVAKKKVGRQITGPSSGFGALFFDVIEVGTLSKSAVKSRYYELCKEMQTVQPFVLGGGTAGNRLDTILENILEVRLDDLYSLFRKCWEASREKSGKGGENTLQEFLKSIRNVLKEPPEIIRTSKELSVKLSFTYFNRQASRHEKGEPHLYKAYKLIVNSVKEYLLKGGGEPRTPFADIDRLIKLVGGGVI